MDISFLRIKSLTGTDKFCITMLKNWLWLKTFIGFKLKISHFSHSLIIYKTISSYLCLLSIFSFCIPIKLIELFYRSFLSFEHHVCLIVIKHPISDLTSLLFMFFEISINGVMTISNLSIFIKFLFKNCNLFLESMYII